MQTLGVVINAEKPLAKRVLDRVGALAKARDLTMLVAADPGVAGQHGRRVTVADLQQSAEAVLVVGGDGTVLNTVRAMDGARVPMMGVNAGSLGFLTSVAAENIDDAFSALVEGRVTHSERALLSCAVERRGRSEFLAHALNDCVISRGASGRIVCLELSVDGRFVTDFVCDGLIVSTPTGSTAYSLSAGGPILLPSTSAMVISLICPHALGSRPLVIPEGARIAVTVREAFAPANVSADGEVEQVLAEGDRVIVEMSDRVVTFAHMPDYDSFEVMRQKLSWHGATKRANRA